MSTPPDAPTFDAMPGYWIRRLQQMAVAVFMEETDGHGLTPVQFAALAAVQRTPWMDQRGLARSIGLDTSTIGGVVDRLEARGLMQRNASPSDRRVRLLTITAAGDALLQTVLPAIEAAQARMLAPLPAADRAEFLRMAQALVAANSGEPRGPGDH